VHQYVFALEHFGNWLGTGSISHESVDEFVVGHIPRCRCKKPASCTLGLIYSRGRVDYVAITSSFGACDGASVGFQLLRAAS